MYTAYIIMGLIWSFIALLCEYEKKGKFDGADIGVCIAGFILWPVLTMMFLVVWFKRVVKG